MFNALDLRFLIILSFHDLIGFPSYRTRVLPREKRDENIDRCKNVKRYVFHFLFLSSIAHKRPWKSFIS